MATWHLVVLPLGTLTMLLGGWMALKQRDLKLMAYMDKAPGARIAHSTADHYVPLLLTMGAADDPRTAKTVFTRVRAYATWIERMWLPSPRRENTVLAVRGSSAAPMVSSNGT